MLGGDTLQVAVRGTWQPFQAALEINAAELFSRKLSPFSRQSSSAIALLRNLARQVKQTQVQTMMVVATVSGLLLSNQSALWGAHARVRLAAAGVRRCVSPWGRSTWLGNLCVYLRVRGWA